MVIDYSNYNITTYIGKKRRKEKEKKYRQNYLKLSKMITKKLLLYDFFMKEKHF